MATVNKDFKVKHGLIVEGTTATVNNHDVLTKKQADQDYIVSLIGGTSTSANTPDTVVKRDGSGNFAAGEITADLVGDVTGQVSDISNHSTTDLSEGTNKYFTDQRAVDANTGLWDESGAASTAYTNAVADAAEDATTKANNAQSAAELTASNALSAAVTDLEGQISDAESNANTYTNTAITNLNLAGTYDALGAAADALDDANAYTDTRETAITSAYQAYADQAETDAIAAAGSYTDTAVANLVDSAPALLDTLNELAAAIGDNPDFIGTVTSAIGEKVAKAGDTMSGDLSMGTNKITSVGAPTANGDAANKLYVDNAASTAQSNAEDYADGLAGNYDPAGSASSAQTAAETFATNAANAAQSNAEDYADSLAVNYDPAGSASSAQSAAESYASGLDSATNTRIDNLDTDDVAEGSNQYFTDSRAKDAAAVLLTGATLTNIQIAGTGAGLTITAENGVADSTTDDLDEGESNLYFTDQRAIDALEAVTPNFTEIDINSVAKQVASTLSAPTAGIQTAYSFAKADYRSAEFLVKVAYGTHTEISKVMLTLDTSDNIAITEYAIVGTNGSASSISAGISGSNVQLQVTTVNNNSEVTVVGTLLA